MSGVIVVDAGRSRSTYLGHCRGDTLRYDPARVITRLGLGKPAGAKSDDNPAGVRSDDNPAGVKSDDNPAGVKPDGKPTGVKSDDNLAGVVR